MISFNLKKCKPLIKQTHFFLVQEVQEEGKNAIDSPGNPMAPALPPEEYALGN